VVQKTKTKNKPYDSYQKTKTWKLVKSALKQLVENQDIEITTDPYYVIGFLTKKIEDSE
jgi:hypothetical protein